MTDKKAVQERVEAVQQLHIREDGATVTLKGRNRDLLLTLDIDTLEELTQLMADALLKRRSGEFDRDAGELLVPGELSQCTVESIPAALGFEEKFVLQARSEGATTLTFRLSLPSVERWILSAQQQIAQRKARSRN